MPHGATGKKIKGDDVELIWKVKDVARLFTISDFTTVLIFMIALFKHVCVHMVSHVQLFVTLWTVAHQASLSMGFSRQEYRSGSLFSSLGDLPDPRIKPALSVSCIAGEFFTTWAIWEAIKHVQMDESHASNKVGSILVIDGSDGKESACNVGDMDSTPGLGRSPGEGNGSPLHFSCLENSTDRGYSPWHGKESDTTEWLRVSLSLFIVVILVLELCSSCFVELYSWKENHNNSFR